MTPVKLTADLIESFAGVFLSEMYDTPRPTPPFHREVWELYCSDHPQCAVAAPRSHAKSTALTFDFVLASVLFRAQDYVVVLGSSEEMAIEHLNDISAQLHENEDLIAEFGIARFISDTKSDIIVECDDGHQFRLVARGAEQKIRGRKWRGKRPGLIVGDDCEDDEQVESRDRRKKFSRWLFRAAKQALRDGGLFRIHGTILHEDSCLANIIKDKRNWRTQCYRAHRSFDDFSEILWPELFPETRLRRIRDEMVAQGDAPGYSQEYLNDPLDNSEAYLRKEDFRPMQEADFDKSMLIYAGADFAVSKKDAANRTSFTIAGQAVDNGIYFRDQYKGRWDASEWIEVMFDIQKRWQPEVFFVEDGVIWKAVKTMVYNEMRLRDLYINIQDIPSVHDKATRGRPFQKRHRAGACYFDKSADWYPEYEYELLRFTGTSQATLDDQFDSSAILVRGLEIAPRVEEDDFESEDEIELRRTDPRVMGQRNAVTGY